MNNSMVGSLTNDSKDVQTIKMIINLKQLDKIILIFSKENFLMKVNQAQNSKANDDLATPAQREAQRLSSQPSPVSTLELLLESLQ